MSFLQWLEQTGLAQYLASDPYAYPIVLCFHALGMASAVGVLWVLSLRIVGFPMGMPPSVLPTLSRIAFYGFALNAVSGLLLFAIDATRMIENAAFLIKMASIFLGMATAWYMVRVTRADLHSEEMTFSAATRAVAIGGAAFWLVAIISGRLIAYTLAPPF